jgi:3-dehydro-L-gulonate 2-dehydrogenase
MTCYPAACDLIRAGEINQEREPMLRISYRDHFNALLRLLLKLGFEPERAQRCARLFADTDRDGVHTHGLNRLPRFLSMIETGLIDIHAQPKLVTSFGPLERWDGKNTIWRITYSEK